MSVSRAIILSHPATWIIGTWFAISGGVKTLFLREQKRAEGSPLSFPSITVERAVDFAFGAGIEVLFLALAVYIVQDVTESRNPKILVGAVVGVYILIKLMQIYLI